MGKLNAIKGSVTINGGLRIGHFTQHHTDNFDLNLSAVENLLNMFEGSEDQVMRSFLGKFQIQGNDALKPSKYTSMIGFPTQKVVNTDVFLTIPMHCIVRHAVALLSGGQKSRVAFAALAVSTTL